MNLNFHEKELLREVFNKSFHEVRYEIEVASSGSRSQLTAMQKQKDLASLYNVIFKEIVDENTV